MGVAQLLEIEVLLMARPSDPHPGPPHKGEGGREFGCFRLDDFQSV